MARKKTVAVRLGLGGLAAIVAAAGTRYWHWYTRPIETPPGTVSAPLAWLGLDRIPIVGLATRLKWVITDPVELAARCRAAYGDVFTLRIPTFSDLTYVTGGEDYANALTLPTDHASIGPVLNQVPTVGYWFPREQDDPQTLQQLIMTGRRMMAELLPRSRVDSIPDQVADIVDRQAADWSDVVDLSDAVYRIVYEVAGRYFVGDEVWDQFGSRFTTYYRRIADGIDIVRAALSITPYHYLMPEYKCTRKLYRLIRDELPAYHGAESPLLRSIAASAIAEEPLSVADRRWMFMYVLWNATNYPGTYTYWTLVDLLARPGLADRVRAIPTRAARHEFLRRCLLETVRMYPVSSLIRFLEKPYEFRRDNVTYHVPAGQLLGVFPPALNRDSRHVLDDADVYDPDRYLRSPAPRIAGFGRGPFGCVAQHFSETVTAAVINELLERYEIVPLEKAPPRRVRVHQTYPAKPLPAMLIPRRVAAHALPVDCAQIIL
ncbi:cytochrome P450 [Mycobacterium bourgelatii]|uniref:Cytochrome P450 n=1 Tax=Mycobacterium bourgelatii TaxID=1273442 RepID=A0A7I9YLB9_MYCBU|nr:cytochrome P450 [Mycobacterium bourgelatii]MCV6976053.1 cytochrome P450 [Mycobacterium bourgelatii]GFG89417.1 cytochrome P450 [Mycobacterium bourgelatii]